VREPSDVHLTYKAHMLGELWLDPVDVGQGHKANVLVDIEHAPAQGTVEFEVFWNDNKLQFFDLGGNKLLVDIDASPEWLFRMEPCSANTDTPSGHEPELLYRLFAENGETLNLNHLDAKATKRWWANSKVRQNH
jgi:hypothetical protein